MEITMIKEINLYSQKSTGDISESIVNLPVLDALLAKEDYSELKITFEKTLIYYVHHPLQTSINVVDSMVSLGAKYNNMFILGKRYSQSDEVVSSLTKRGVHYQPCSMQLRIGQYSTSFIRDINWLWLKLLQHLNPSIENILVLDHGGHAVKYLPPEILEHYRVIAIEKTSAGLFELDKHGNPPFPLIDVANCAAKRYFESPLIAKAVVNKLFNVLPSPQANLHYGVVGLGAIGQAIVERLLSMGQRLVIFDINSELMKKFEHDSRVVCAKDSRDLIAVCDYIFGCSGRDISESSLEQFRLSAKDKTLVSCSSEDKEFLSLLHLIEKQKPLIFDPLDTIEYHSELGATIRLLRGGFPANFDNSGESVPANEIQLTRALVVGAVLQAAKLFNNKSAFLEPSIHALNQEIQEFIVSEWFQHQNLSINDALLMGKYNELFTEYL